VSARIVQPSVETIATAAQLLRAGHLVAFPTETVYGLGADATSDASVRAIYRAKGRPAENPLIVHVADLPSAEAIAAFDVRARALARAYWPGSLTLVLPLRGQRISALATAGLDTVAVRVPDHPVALELLRTTALPLAAPSANRSGRLSPTTAQHVLEGLPDAVELILDGGACRVGIESTVVALDGAKPRLLRPGAIAPEAIAQTLGMPVLLPEEVAALQSPGQMPSHYAPRAAVRLNARAASPGEAALTFGGYDMGRAHATIDLSTRGDLGEAAARLYAALRRLDQSGVSSIAVAPIPERGVGVAINDRLRRAAAPRPQE
jgi:L-threonylcarbamoyladenylate synthase